MTDNWFADYSSVVEMMETIVQTLSASKADIASVRMLRTRDVQNASLRRKMYTHGPDLSLLLQQAEDIAHNINKNHRTPSYAAIQKEHLPTSCVEAHIWNKVLTGDDPDTKASVLKCNEALAFMNARLQEFVDEQDSGHSSYSDYSETETDSDEDQDADKSMNNLTVSHKKR